MSVLDALGFGEAGDVLAGSDRDRPCLPDSQDRWRSCPCRCRAHAGACLLGAMARTASEFGRFLAQSVVPSSGSTREVDAGTDAGADLLANVEHRRFVALALADDDAALDVDAVSSSRMASTAARSAAISSPRPRNRAAAIAARSVTRTSSSVSARSSTPIICFLDITISPRCGLDRPLPIAASRFGSSAASRRRGRS